MKFPHLAFPLFNYTASADEERQEREEPTVKLDLAIERLRDATERRERASKRAVSNPALPAVKVGT